MMHASHTDAAQKTVEAKHEFCSLHPEQQTNHIYVRKLSEILLAQQLHSLYPSL